MSRRIVDAHTHLFQKGFLPDAWYRGIAHSWSGRTWPHRDPSVLDAEGGIVDPGEKYLLAEIETSGVDAVVSMGLDWGVAYGEAPVSPREVAAYYGDMQRRHNGVFNGILGVDPRRTDAVDIIRQGIEVDGLKGVKLYPPCGYFADDEACDKVYDLCLELGVPVVIHSAYVGYPHRGYYADPIRISSVQHRYPDLTIVLAHAGHEMWLDNALAVAASHPNTYLDISNWNEGLAHDVDEVTHAVTRMFDEVGAHKLLFASDYLGGRRFSSRAIISGYLDFIDSLPSRTTGKVSNEQLDLVLGENAIRVYNINLD